MYVPNYQRCYVLLPLHAERQRCRPSSAIDNDCVAAFCLSFVSVSRFLCFSPIEGRERERDPTQTGLTMVFNIHGIIFNILVPPLCLALLLCILPPYLLFKVLHCVLRSMLSENVAGKVILITGASSGIGEVLAHPIPTI